MAENIRWANPNPAASFADWRNNSGNGRFMKCHCRDRLPHQERAIMGALWCGTTILGHVRSRGCESCRDTTAAPAMLQFRNTRGPHHPHVLCWRAGGANPLCCDTPCDRIAPRAQVSLRGRIQGGSCRSGERFVAIVQRKEDLAEVAAMAGMASGDVGRSDW
jgi:hypothetical protein